jgi:hypothetical protein
MIGALFIAGTGVDRARTVRQTDQMGRIVVVQHESVPPDVRPFALQLLVNRWLRAGHKVRICSGIERLPDADLALLHVDLSVVPDAYSTAVRRYPRVINDRATDIRKTNISRIRVARSDGWEGPVIVKTDLNCGGVPELRAYVRNRNAGRPTGEVAPPSLEYRIYDRVDLVPDPVWSRKELIVERFLPEQDEAGYYLRTWIFFGAAERCRRFRSAKRYIKGNDYLSYEPAVVPDLLRAERERLGIDYGKFDFVVRDGEPILLDANKTPGMPPSSKPILRDAYADLAGGIDQLLALPAPAQAVALKSERRP